jgi:hypothetical protein
MKGKIARSPIYIILLKILFRFHFQKKPYHNSISQKRMENPIKFSEKFDIALSTNNKSITINFPSSRNQIYKILCEI